MDNPNREIPSCEVCQQPANQVCGGCKLVHYCSRAHQKLGWREGHKFKCCAFKIQYSETLGRHMVASRDIKQGEMILKEKPAALGPTTSCLAQCLSCAKRLSPIKREDKYDFYKCTSCGWPMCGLDCEKADIHKAECNLMSERKYRSTIKYESPDKVEAAYCVIAPLRVLMMKETNPMQYENIMALESHVEERLKTPLYIVLKANLVTFIVQVLAMPFDEETILKVASIFDTNAFEVRSHDGLKKVRAIYVTSSMMNHDCIPNTRHIFVDNEHNLALIATMPIAKGEPITATYTQSLWGTLDRRRHLNTNKFFGCTCKRCQDPTELGTFLGSIYCSICNGPGVIDKSMLLSSNPLDENAPWKCRNCSHTILSKQMVWGNNVLRQDLNKLNKLEPNDFEDFILKYSLTLHPTNHLVIQAKLALVQIYGNRKGYGLSEISDQLLKRKIDLCHELIEVGDKIEPGWTRFRGTLLLDLQSAMTVQAKREFESGKITKEAAQDQLMQSMALLQEAVNILKVEPHFKESLENKVKELASLIDSNSENSSDCPSMD